MSAAARWTAHWGLWLAGACALAGCAGTGAGATGIGGAEQALHPAIVERLGPDAHCSAPAFCGDLVAVDCGSEVDGPLYYFDNRSGAPLMTCGGACDMPESMRREGQCTACPPPQWLAACPQR